MKNEMNSAEIARNKSGNIDIEMTVHHAQELSTWIRDHRNTLGNLSREMKDISGVLLVYEEGEDLWRRVGLLADLVDAMGQAVDLRFRLMWENGPGDLIDVNEMDRVASKKPEPATTRVASHHER